MHASRTHRTVTGLVVATLVLSVAVSGQPVRATDGTPPGASEMQRHVEESAPGGLGPTQHDPTQPGVRPPAATQSNPADDAAANVAPETDEAPANEADASAELQDHLCAPDPAGDTFREDNDEAIDEPRADLVEFCADYGGDLTVEAVVDQPVNPESDEGWSGASALYWFIDSDGDGYRHSVVYGADSDGLYAEVVRIDDDGSEEVTCAADASYRDGRYIASGIDPDACLEDAGQRLDIAVITAYDTGDVVAMDVSDAFIAVGRDGEQPVRNVNRLAGSDRIATAVQISSAAFSGSADTVYLATAEEFPDALAAGPLADGPTLLVPSCGQLPGVVADEIARLEPSTVVGLGGGAAVCDALLGQAAAEVQASTDRLAGPSEAANRFGTSAAISRRVFPNGAQDVYLATGEDFPDALAAGSLTDGPILLVPSCGDLPDVIADEISRTGADRVLALGGASAVCDDMLDTAVSVSGGTGDRLDGEGRFHTAAAIARFQFPDGADTVYLATGEDFPDALAAGSLTDGPVVLTPPCGDIPVVVANAIRALDPNAVAALGGDSAVCDEMLRHAGNA